MKFSWHSCFTFWPPQSLPKPWRFLLEWCPESLQGLSSLLHESWDSRLLPLIFDPILLYLSRTGQVLLWILSFPLPFAVSNAVCSAQMFHQLYSFGASRAMVFTNVLWTNLERTTRGPKQTGSSRIHSPTGQCLGNRELVREKNFLMINYWKVRNDTN